ncbi:MAG: RNase adapter RapZ [Clostridia bacterium]|nr:RNase adapter RapZ [Clostridia bacterium]
MQFTVVTGLSGSGKSQVANFLEDMGFFCIDNLPPALIPQFAELFMSGDTRYEKVALVIDTRVGEMINELKGNLETLKSKGYRYTLLFTDASDDVLIKRYEETRRLHPVKSELGLLGSIEEERKMLFDLKSEADHIIDTSNMLVNDLYKEVRRLFPTDDIQGNMAINVLAFGFKYGIPKDADLVFDVRCFPNPFYIDELKYKTGNDKEVRDYVLSTNEARSFLDKLNDMILMLLPLYVEEGKSSVTIAIGCTGGKHRSVTFANLLSERLKKENYSVNTICRDIEKGRK